jgi:hypothetical protein
MNEQVNKILANAGYDEVKQFAAIVRNETIDEVAEELEKFRWAFGGDTVDSFVIFVRGLKND